MIEQTAQSGLKKWRCKCGAYLCHYHPDYPLYLYREVCPGCKQEVELDRRWVRTKGKVA